MFSTLQSSSGKGRDAVVSITKTSAYQHYQQRFAKFSGLSNAFQELRTKYSLLPSAVQASMGIFPAVYMVECTFKCDFSLF